MKRFIFLIHILFYLSNLSYSQTFTDSNLPIVILNTDGGVEIRDTPRVLATMKIIYRGTGVRNYLTDQNTPAYLNYNGRIDIEIRGSSSQVLAKKQYGLSTKKTDNISNNNVSLLGLPSENDWILNGLAFDPSLIRDYLCYNLSRMIGEYASRTVFCELMLNGVYKGLYVLQEKIKQGSDRVNISKITSEDNTFPNVTGGYITKADKTTGGDPIAWTMSSYIGTNDVAFIHELPKPENVTTFQNTYIQSEFEKLSSTVSTGNVSFENGYPSVIDIPSFVDYMILNELSANVDAYQFSTFYHKDRNGKLRAGPIWDMNLTYGNDLFIWGFDRSKTNTWQFSNGDNEGPRFWRDLFNNPEFRCYLSKRWNQLIQPGQPLNISSIESFIDQTVATISEAAVRENALWGTVGNHPNEIIKLKAFLNQRIPWMTTLIGPSSNCSDVGTPSLVITKIMYNPNTTIDFSISNDQEFIEIKNTGNKTVNLTGVYFSGTGFVYQFPVYSQIFPNATKILASNATVFRAKYGFPPSGQFTRNLSNSGQNLVLADGFGNVIDNVQYSNLSPWPNASANGYFLELTDPFSDNSIATNWTASISVIVSVEDTENDQSMKFYPSPVKDNLTVESADRINTIQLLDIQGCILQTINVNTERYSIDMTSCLPGTYLIKVIKQDRSFVRKIIKE
ncbi:MAG: CotH kinase family protein [Bacteroidia bacterium]|nr:CotH kinase family protein [Bacteroidia bacterium]